MKHSMMTKCFPAVLALVFFPITMLGQTNGDFRSTTSGRWCTQLVWQKYNGSEWVPATSIPDGSTSITIQNGTIITIDTSITIKKYFKAESVLVAVGKSLTVSGTYEHTADGGTVPIAIWNPGSVLKFSGIKTKTSSHGLNQLFANVIYDCPDQTAGSNSTKGYSFTNNSSMFSVREKLTIANTGSGYLVITSSGQDTVVTGEFEQSGGRVYINCDASSDKFFIVKRNANVRGKSSELCIAGANENPSGTTKGAVHIGGDLIVADSAILRQQYSYAAKIEMNGAVVQTVNPGTIFGKINFIIDNSEGTVHLAGDLITSGSLALVKGLVYIGNYNISVSSIIGGSDLAYVVPNARGSLKQWVDSTAVKFPVGMGSRTAVVNVSNNTKCRYITTPFEMSYNPITITNTGIPDTFSVRMPWYQVTTCGGIPHSVAIIWNITERVAGGSKLDLALQWAAKNEFSAFSRSIPTYIRRNRSSQGSGVDSTLWFAVTVMGTDPFTVSASNIELDGDFQVRNNISDPVIEEKTIVVDRFLLASNYPNPFNPSTTIKYSLPNNSMVSLKVFNMIGQEVATLINSYQKSGEYTVRFNAANLSGGVYFYRLNAGSFNVVKKMLLLK